MTFEILDMLSLPGDPTKPNDDAFCHSKTLAAVFDGATGLGEQILPVDSDAAWIARRGAEGLIAHEAPHLTSREILRCAAADAEQMFFQLRRRPQKETYEIPFASMIFVAVGKDGAEALWFGDCAALVKRPGEDLQIVGEAFARREREARELVGLASVNGVAPASSHNRPEFLAFLRAKRNSVNSRPGGWLFSPDARCADQAKRLAFAAPSGTRMLLTSDGFLALASDYGRYRAEALVEGAAAKGLRALYNELREIENGDPEGRRYPRFKKSDDATAVLLRVG